MTASWGDFGLEPEEVHRALARDSIRFEPGAALRAFYEIYAERQGKPRWGDKTPIYVKNMRRDRVGAPRGALHPRDPRRPRRRAVALEADARRQGPARRCHAGRRGLGAPDPPRAASRARSSTTTWSSATRTCHRHRARAARAICEFIELDWDPVDAPLLRARRRADGRDGARPPGDRRQADPPRRGADAGPRDDAEAAGPRARCTAGRRRWPPRTSQTFDARRRRRCSTSSATRSRCRVASPAS